MLSIIRRKREEEGFTLIELMVVVLIIAILIAIAVPTFLGARKRAQDRAVQSNARNAFTAEKTIYTDAQAYADFDDDLDASGAADLGEIEPSLTFVDGQPSTLTAGGRQVHATLSGGYIYLAVRSASGSCFYMRDNSSTPTQFARDTAPPCADVTDAGLTWSNNPW